MTPRQPHSRKMWKWMGLGLALFAAAIAVRAVRVGPNARLGPIRGLVLGSGPAQARSSWEERSSGRFRATSDGEGYALDWTPENADSDVRAARLEFHLGQLVALRLTLAPDAPEASGPPLRAGRSSIVTREPSGRGTQLTWLARGCPAHAEEVRRRTRGR